MQSAKIRVRKEPDCSLLPLRGRGHSASHQRTAPRNRFIKIMTGAANRFLKSLRVCGEREAGDEKAPSRAGEGAEVH